MFSKNKVPSVYVTGDMHGDIGRFLSRPVRKLRRGDYLVVLGDFGFLWDGGDKEQKALKWIGKRKYTTLFIEGCNDNCGLLDEYPPVPYHGGMARQINGRLYHLSRGGVFTIADKKLFAFGGGEHPDADRAESCDSVPTDSQMKGALENLLLSGGAVDYILTHDAPMSVKNFIGIKDGITTDGVLYRFLEQIANNAKFNKWYFGFHHIDKVITKSYTAVYKNVIKLE